MPMDRLRATELLDHLHAAQNEFYGGGSDASLREILNSEIVWTVPGTNLIAGVYRGLDAVLDYFARRRDLSRVPQADRLSRPDRVECGLVEREKPAGCDVVEVVDLIEPDGRPFVLAAVDRGGAVGQCCDSVRLPR